MGRLTFIVVLFSHFTFHAQAAVLVDAIPASQDWAKELKVDLASFITSGEVDGWNLRFRVEGELSKISHLVQKDEQGNMLLPLTAASYKLLDKEAQKKLVTYLTTYYDREGNSVYQVNVATKEGNDLKAEPALIRLGVPFDQLEAVVRGERLLSSYGQKWAWKWSDYSGPNCFHTSVAAIFAGWDKHRYMGPRELMCHQKTHFEAIQKPEAWGDMISFNDVNDVPIHAFTYLGVDRKNPNRALAFTKNGYARSRFLMMSYGGIYGIYQGYGIRYIRYYRPKADVQALDPAAHPSAPCAREHQYRWEALERRNADPSLEMGIKEKPPESFEPLQLE